MQTNLNVKHDVQEVQKIQTYLYFAVCNLNTHPWVCLFAVKYIFPYKKAQIRTYLRFQLSILPNGIQSYSSIILSYFLDYNYITIKVFVRGTEPLCRWWLILPIQNDAKKLKNEWNPGNGVLIWEYSARAFQWIPTWQGLDGFQKSLHPCALNESSLSIRRVKWYVQDSIETCSFVAYLSKASSVQMPEIPFFRVGPDV